MNSSYVEYRAAKEKHEKNEARRAPRWHPTTLQPIYMAAMPTSETGDKVVLYADDGLAMGSGPKIAPICDNRYLNELDTWYKARNLFISAPKS